ncbi:MAG: hypothetical protein NTY42_00330 [Planctomycetota bacterium]|nr:hypothetical protein [Planctomycetota bacterium]
MVLVTWTFWELSALDRETLVTMNDGSFYDIPDHKSAMVDSAICYVLTRSENGKLQAVWLSLVRMVKVERITTVAA